MNASVLQAASSLAAREPGEGRGGWREEPWVPPFCQRLPPPRTHPPSPPPFMGPHFPAAARISERRWRAPQPHRVRSLRSGYFANSWVRCLMLQGGPPREGQEPPIPALRAPATASPARLGPFGTGTGRKAEIAAGLSLFGGASRGGPRRLPLALGATCRRTRPDPGLERHLVDTKEVVATRVAGDSPDAVGRNARRARRKSLSHRLWCTALGVACQESLLPLSYPSRLKGV